MTAKPTAYLEELVLFLWDDYDIHTTKATISRTLKRLRVSRKVLQREAAQRSEVLRDQWIVRLSGWTADQLVFIDESAANKHSADRKYG